MTKNELIDQIYSVFEKVPFPRNGMIVASEREESQEVQLFLKDTRWQDVSTEFLFSKFCYGGAVLGFMTKRAFRYYFPAFMLIAVKDYYNDKAPADTAIYHTRLKWSTKEDLKTSQFAEFSDEELHVVAEFMKYMLDAYPDEFDIGCDLVPTYELPEAIKGGWSKYLGLRWGLRRLR